MARLFTLTFPFEQNEYEAQIKVDDASNANAIYVYLPDRKLHHLLPEGKAVLTTEDTQMELPKDTTPVEQLKFSILNAFAAHENQSPPINIW